MTDHDENRPDNDNATLSDDEVAAANRGQRAPKSGSGEVTGSGADAGGGGNPEDYDDSVGGRSPVPRGSPAPAGSGRDAPIGGMR